MGFVTPLSVMPLVMRPCTTWCQTSNGAYVKRSRTIPHIVKVRRSFQKGRNILATDMSGSIPASFEASCEQARGAVLSALAMGQRKLFVELDTTNGDATYTTLKTTVPTVRALVHVFNENPVQIVFPDAGAAALARRDWANDEAREDTVTNHNLVGLEQYIARDGDAAVVVVVPRASEVDRLAALVREAGDSSVIVVNPDLVDMGVTGLSLNARRLRMQVIDLFESVYYLRVFPWGIMYRCFPGSWTVWLDDANEASGFRCIATLPARPSTDELQELLDEQATGADGADSPGPIGRAFNEFRRFVNVYKKG